MEKSQAALEYLILSAVLTLIISAVLWYSFSINTNASIQVRISQLESFVNSLKEKSDIVCFQGRPAKLTFSAYIPSGVTSAGFDNHTVYYRIRIDSTTTYISSTSLCKLNGSLPVNEGTYNIIVEAQEGYVNVTF
ncbi:MAG: hypothetical protein QMD12_00765 [Candidatus Aenigmarchaeota archaeon]|nr:hypothetical protein [Candidatus Aenigmarchaeota archaeon]